MRHTALGKHGWSVLLALLLFHCSGGAANAAPNEIPAQIAIGSPLPNSLVAGRISLSVAYSTGFHQITAFTVYVDDALHQSRDFIGMQRRGIQYLDLDTRALADGNHTVRIVARGTRGVLAQDSVNITVRNGVAGGVDVVPPLVQFRNLLDGQEVSGKVSIDVLAEDNTTTDLLVSIFVNRFPRLIRSSPPYTLELDTSEYLDKGTNTGTIKLEAWAYDRFNNLGKSKQLTLNVVLKPNLTRKQDDPTATAPAPMENMAPKDPVLIIPLPVPGLDMPMAAKSPGPIPGPREGRPVMTRQGSAPGGRPEGTRVARARTEGIEPEFAPLGSASRPGLASGKAPLPYTPARPRYSPSETAPAVRAPAPVPAGRTPGGALAGSRTQTPGRPGPGPSVPVVRRSGPAAPPALAAGSRGASALTGPRSAVPGGRPKSALMARAAAADPELRPAPARAIPGMPVEARPEPGGPRVSMPPSRPGTPESARPEAAAGGQAAGPLVASAQAARAEMLDMPGAELPVESAGPVASTGARSSMPGERALAPRRPTAVAKAVPAVPAAKPAANPLVLVVPRGARADGKGRVPVEVYSMGPRVPQDRSYRVRRGDNLLSVAKKFNVTVRSLLVANGLAGPKSLRSGSVLKVPGTFDIVMNDRQVGFDVSPRVENGLPLTPFRQIFEHAGGVVVWDAERREVRAANEDRDVRLQIGSKEATVNQVIVVMDREAFLDSGRTIVPLSFMEKVLDLKAEYDVKSGTIILGR